MSNILISYPSWEERSYLGLENTIKQYEVQFFIIIRNTRSLYEKEVSCCLRKIKSICKTNDVDIQFVDIQSDGINIWNVLKECISKFKKEDEVILDITTMSRNIIWALLFFFKEIRGQIKIIYYQPDHYSDTWISKEPDTPRLLFKHSGIIELGLPTYLIIITGYDPERTRQVLSYYEPKKVFLLIQTGEQLFNDERNTEELHKAVCTDLGISNVEIVQINSYSSDFGFSSINEVIISNKGMANFIVTSLGPKLSAIGVYKCYMNHPEIALSYIPCKEYNAEYCKGIGEKFEMILALDK